MAEQPHVAIVGGGAVGAALAHFLSRREVRVTLLEKNTDVGFGVSKANSGIVHGGFHTPVTELKGRLELKGNQMFDELEAELHFPFRRCGIVMAAFTPEELETVRGLYQRGVDNGVPGMEWCAPERMRELEPKLAENCLGGLFAPQGGVVEPYGYVFALCEQAKRNGAEVLTDFEVVRAERKQDKWRITAADGRTVSADWAVNCAGLYADRVSAIFGAEKLEILPRKGEEYLLDRNAAGRPNHVVFPVPSPVSKGVLVIPTVGGTTMVGPTARMTEDKTDVSTSEDDRRKIFELARKMVPAVDPRDVIGCFAGLRPVLQPDGKFMLKLSEIAPAFVQAAGVQSPGLTASPAIAEYLTGLMEKAGLCAPAKKTVAPPLEEVKPLREMTPEEADAHFQQDPAWTRIVCRCETVSEAEIVRAVRLGHRTLDGVKFFTRAGMGRCQGGFCTSRIIRIIARETGMSVEEITKRGGASRLTAGRTQ